MRQMSQILMIGSQLSHSLAQGLSWMISLGGLQKWMILTPSRKFRFWPGMIQAGPTTLTMLTLWSAMPFAPQRGPLFRKVSGLLTSVKTEVLLGTISHFIWKTRAAYLSVVSKLSLRWISENILSANLNLFLTSSKKLSIWLNAEFKFLAFTFCVKTLLKRKANCQNIINTFWKTQWKKDYITGLGSSSLISHI